VAEPIASAHRGDIVLASGSPRRRELLAQLGLRFTIACPDVDETPLADEAPVPYVHRLAIAKAHAVVVADDAIVIAADTTVDLGGQILAKPVDADDARAMLHRLSGCTHQVHTGVALRLGERTVAATVTSLVTFTMLTTAMVDWYVATGEPLDKAGAYAVQGAGGVFVERVDGSVSNVIGLPLHTVVQLATDLGVALLG
jgi:septum formation protein